MTEEKVVEDRLSVDVRAQMLAKEDSVFFNVAKFEHAQRVAKLISDSDLVPDHFKKNVQNCFIALNLAVRMGVDPFMLMNSLYVVYGRPGFEAKLLIALIQGGGRFGPLYYKFDGQGKTRSCYAYATEIKTGLKLEGPPVTWEMVEAEGWSKPKERKGGGAPIPSKWITMPDLMFRYRAATFFARVYDPGALMGLRTVEEIEDVTPTEIRVDKFVKFEKESPSMGQVEEGRKKLLDAAPPQIKEAPEFLVEFELFLGETADALRKPIAETTVLAAEEPKDFWKAFAKNKKDKEKKFKKEPVPEPVPLESIVVGPDSGTATPPVETPLPMQPKPVGYLKRLLERYGKAPKLYFEALNQLHRGEVVDEETAKLVWDKMDEIEKRAK